MERENERSGMCNDSRKVMLGEGDYLLSTNSCHSFLLSSSFFLSNVLRQDASRISDISAKN